MNISRVLREKTLADCLANTSVPACNQNDLLVMKIRGRCLVFCVLNFLSVSLKACSETLRQTISLFYYLFFFLLDFINFKIIPLDVTPDLSENLSSGLCVEASLI